MVNTTIHCFTGSRHPSIYFCSFCHFLYAVPSGSFTKPSLTSRPSMRHSHFFMVALATTFLSSCVALSTTGATTNSNGEHLRETPLEALRLLRGVQIDDGILRSHKQDNADEDREERAGGWLDKFRYQSKGAHGAEELNQVTMARYYLQDNPQLFNQIRHNKAKRFETYSVWRGMKYHSGDVKRAMEAHGFTKDEYEAFVKEFKKFKPEDLRIQ